MKITIDTKEDSQEEIRNIIKMLSSLVDKKEVMSNEGDMFSDNNDSEQNTNMFSMFSSSSAETKTEEEKTEDEKTEENEIEEDEKTDVDLDIPEFEEYD